MSQQPLHRRERLYIDGEWRDTDDVLEVTDLADGGTFAQIAAASPEQADDALAAAQRAQSAMRGTTIPQRGEWMTAIADELLERKEELAEVIVREAGKPISSASSEVSATAERFRRAQEEIRSLKGEFREGTTEGHEDWDAIVKHEPMGTVLAIGPYNYPLSTTALSVAPALATGNSVVLKPASDTPISAAILADVVSEVGLPDGAFNFVPGRGSEIGDVLSGDERINVVSMTGSSAAGKHVAKESGMVNLHMELGGNAPAVVFPDADLSDVAGQCAKGSFKYAGQRCSAVSRVLAHESVHDEVVEQIEAQMDAWQPGDLFEDDTTMGPLINEGQVEWVEELVEDAVERGADLVRGGERGVSSWNSDGPADLPSSLEDVFFEPTLLANVPQDARIVHEEQFGPVAAVTTFETEEEAIEVANSGNLALDASVFTSDHDRAMRMADELDAGAVRINGAPSHGLGDIPFGGNKSSGIGRQGLHTTIEEMVRKKSIIL